jgi:hypothetical protein
MTMIVGVDLDDTISELPEFFSVLTAALVDAGHEVHVITYRQIGTDDAVRAELAALGLRYTALHLPRTACSPPEWKAALAAELGIDLMIEDSPEVLARMPSGVRRLWLCDPEVFSLDVCIGALRGRMDAPGRGARLQDRGLGGRG